MWEEGEDLEDVETFEPLKQYVTGSFEEETDERSEVESEGSNSRNRGKDG